MLGSIIGSVINAGAGLLGSALAPKPNYKAAARDAFKGEFNARMGAAEKYGISKLVMAGAPAVGGSPVSVGNPVGEAIANMGADIGGAISRHMNATEKAVQMAALDKVNSENELVKAQTRNINMRTIREATPPRPPFMGIGTPAIFGADGPPQVPGSRLEPPPLTTHFRWGGKDIPLNTNYSDTAFAENRWGEGVSDWIYGPSVFFNDMVQSGYRPHRTGGRPKVFYYTGGGF